MIAAEYRPFDTAFGKLTTEIQTTVITENRIVSLTKLHERYIELLKEEDIDGKDYKRQKLYKRLQKHMGNAIEFWCSPYKTSQPSFICKILSEGQVNRNYIQAI